MRLSRDEPRTVGILKSLWAPLLVCALFAYIQMLDLNHYHANSGSDATCVICGHTANTPIAHSTEFISTPIFGLSLIVTRYEDSRQYLNPPVSYLSRAPPLA